MLIRKEINVEQIKRVLREKEFGPDVVADAPLVAVVMTQGWCPQWNYLNAGLAHLEATGEPVDRTIHVFSLVYDESEYFYDFMRLKENVFGNSLIPYVRYYRDGVLIDQSNYVSTASFLSRWKQ